MRLTKDSYFLFSGGEVHYSLQKHIQSQNNIVDNFYDIVCLDYTMNGFMAMAEYVQVLRKQAAPAKVSIRLTYPYFPYGRQDRQTSKDEPFSLKIFAQFLNSLQLDQVTTWDPHSDVIEALVDNIKIVTQHSIVHKVVPEQIILDPHRLLICPDAGAYKKIGKLENDDERIIIATKQRNVLGQVIRTDICSPLTVQGRDCLIVDDICDGGRTFIELAKVLSKCHAKSIHLYVTHGIFSQGLDPLKNSFIDHVYTTNSFTTVEDPEFLTRVVL